MLELKNPWRRVIDILIAILTALATTASANAAGLFG
jgi:hypothetical protein